MNPTLYDILGVSPDASREDIRKAWREAADRFEPGEGGSTKQFRLFNEAAEVLLDPQRREEYDAQLGDRADAGSTTPSAAAEPAAEAPGKPSPDVDEPADGPNEGQTQDGDADAAEEAAEEGGADASTVPASPVPGAAAATAGSLAANRSGSGEEDASGPGESDHSSAATDDGSAAAPAGLRVPWAALIGLAVVTAVVVGVAAFFVVQAQRAEAYQEALDRAPAAAENAATAVLSYDYQSLEADRDAAAKFLTDDYRTQYVETFDKLVSENATDTKATVKAQVLASSAMTVGEERDPHEVSVLLFVNQSTTSAATSGQPSVALNRVRFDMVERDGTWLVDGITSY